MGGDGGNSRRLVKNFGLHGMQTGTGQRAGDHPACARPHAERVDNELKLRWSLRGVGEQAVAYQSRPLVGH
ncbi:hypothetical protein CJ255_00375 [Candidatus Viridilinea mediisalina]|uniref:Uncharacterized protein n=1 Tax=Candidatus Viridilinea mediisalina TaxID=2024553 RepID=A0A2A6RPU5_9CHLR|nr:hypothetical protein CJ255_00375 [Candidatus Viridilinea mediisalina]